MSDRIALEALESRQMLAAHFTARINFAPETGPAVRGYRLDYGTTYGVHNNGLTYGWNTDKRADTSYAESVYANPRGDSHVTMDEYDTWSIAVPNGYYNVRALMGAAGATGDYRINAEGQPLVKGKPYPGFPFIEGITTVRVTDGQLTVTTADRAHDNLLDSIQFTATDAPAPTRQGVPIQWQRDNAIEAPIGRVESAVVRMGDALVVMGGFVSNEYDQVTSRVDVLNLKTGEWTRWADLPGPQTHIAAATDGRYIYAAGGQTGPLLSDDLTNAVWRFDPKKNVWQPFGELPTIRAGAQMQYLDGKLHVIGGDDATRVVAQSSHYVLDLADPSAGWTEAAPLPTATDHHTSIVVNDELYVIGGEIDHGTSYFTRNDFYRYDAGHDRWVTLPPMPLGTSHQEGATLTDGRRIFIIAGQADVQQMTGNVYSYDIASGNWEEHTAMPTARKGGVAWLDGDTFTYVTGDDASYGQPTWAYRGVIG